MTSKLELSPVRQKNPCDSELCRSEMSIIDKIRKIIKNI